MCLKCVTLVRSRKLREPNEFFDLVEKLRGYIAAGTVEIVQANSPIEDLRADAPLQDNYFFVLRCTRCGKEFELSMDTYRGHGQWS